MQITVRLIGAITEGRFKESPMELSDSARIEDILLTLGLPANIVGVILHNGHPTNLAGRPVDGDIVTILPLLGGG